MEKELLKFFISRGFETINYYPKTDVSEPTFILWMEEVKMWLRDRYKIFAWVNPSHTHGENTFHPKLDFVGNGSIALTTKYDSYGDALMVALNEVRKYI